MTAIEIAGAMVFCVSAIGGLLALTMTVPWAGLLAIGVVACAVWSMFAHASMG